MTKHDMGLKNVFRRLRSLIETKYRIPVEICDVQDPNTGAFDGANIQIDFSCDLGMSVFVLLHLFGHCVQWCTHEPYRTIDKRVKIGADEATIQEAQQYELEASRYGLSLLHELGVYDMDQWVSDWRGSDWSYLEHYYRTGILGKWEEFRDTDFELIDPISIPAFTPMRFETRYAF